MPKLPRDLGGDSVVKAFERLGYRVVPRAGKGSHAKLEAEGKPTLTVPMHGAIKVGTLSALIAAAGISREEFLDLL